MKHVLALLTAAGIIAGYAGQAESAIKISEIDACTNFPRVTVKAIIDLPVHSASLISKQNFTLLEDGKTVGIVDTVPATEKDAARNTIIAIDTSKSISHIHFEKIKRTARAIIEGFSPNDRTALVRFNDQVINVSDFTASHKQLFAHLSVLQRHGRKTLLYSALYESLKKLEESNAAEKSIIVFTDGKDEGSPVRIDDVISLSRRLKAPIHVFCPAKRHCSDTIERIARETGGMFGSDIEKATPALFRHTDGIPQKAEYRITYETTALPDGKSHQIEVRFAAGQVSDRAFGRFSIPGTTTQPLHIPNVLDMLLIALILILIILLILLIAILIRNRKAMFVATLTDFSKEKRQKMPWEDVGDAAKAHSPTLTPQDPEFVYSKAWLVMKDGPSAGKKFPIFWDETTIGREETNTIVIPDQAVSLAHAKIKRFKDAYMIFDLVSENGTVLNGKKLLRPKNLCDWDEIKIGRTILIFRGSKINES